MKTGKKAWVGQRKADIAKKGKSKAPWVVFWNEPSGKRKEKSCGPGRDGRLLAMKECERLHAAIISDTYESKTGGTWTEFVAEYLDDIAGQSENSHAHAKASLEHFERIAKPKRMAGITTNTLREFISKRRREPGKKPGSVVSPATVNANLRYLKSAFRKAVKWGYMARAPDFDFERESEPLKAFVTPEHFHDIYQACDSATKPQAQGFAADDWWRALLITAYMTGWRIGETLELRRENVDPDTGIAKLPAKTTKARRAEVLRLHPIVVEHLEKLVGFGPRYFEWPHHRRTLDVQFHAIQKAAGIHLPCIIEREHECTETCHLYGFHDERRAFATNNHGHLSDDELQGLMRHRDRKTTLRYKNMVGHLHAATDKLFVPSLPMSGTDDA